MNSETRIDYIAAPVSSLSGKLTIPGDKSISHRAIIFGAIAEGETRISGLLDSEDARATMDVFKNMKVKIDNVSDKIVIQGVGLNGLTKAEKPFYFGNSGTSIRLLAGILAAQKFDSTLTGDESLSKRPMLRIVEPLNKMGAEISCSEGGTLPMKIKGGKSLRGFSYELPVASAQLKSSLLLAGLYAQGVTRIIEPAVTRDHTERMLKQFGGKINRDDKTIEITPGALKGVDIIVPGDISSAAFFIVAGCICPGADILLENVGINPTRSAIIEIMRLMGGDIEVDELSGTSTEPVANIRVRYSKLKGINIPTQLVPVAIDEFPVIMVAAAYAEGETILSNAAELRVKESDRIEAMAEGLTSLGIEVSTQADGMRVLGGKITGGEIDSYGDHRIAMAFSIASINATSPVTIRDCVNVNTSFPGFIESANSLGCDISVHHA